MDKNIQANALANEAVDKLKEALGGCADFDGKVILLFSGGRDSSIVASAFCQAFPQGQLHLLFIDNGNLDNTDVQRKQYELIKNLNPNSDIRFETKQVRQLMKRVAIQEIEKDFIERKFSSLLICVPCKLIMAYTALKYAKENDIKFVLDGFAIRQKKYPEQNETFINAQKNIFSKKRIKKHFTSL